MKKIKMLKAGNDFLHIKPEEMVYLESNDHYCNLYLSTKKAPIILYGNFVDWSKSLQEYLIPVRRGVALNPDYVKSLKYSDVTIEHMGQKLEFSFTKENLFAFRENMELINE